MTDRELLNELFAGGERTKTAWREFLRQYSNLFLKIIWTFERDHDNVMDKYLFVCSKLADNDFASLRTFDPHHKHRAPKLSTWLTVVVQNLCVEAYRASHGRKRYPQALLRMSAFDREVFNLWYWKGFALDEIESHVRLRRNGFSSSVAASLRRIHTALTRSSRQKLLQSSPVEISFDDTRLIEGIHTPDEQGELEAWLENSLEKLSVRERVAIRLRFYEDLTAAEIAAIMKIQPVRRVYTLLENALRKLRLLATSDLSK
ncbi:MAG TPA: sigma-70 family RNA polymerase sigma factor [Bacteroidota bacterium]|nr:sigma-70 family RNA polymerase sigma factor [Bacteroidota bacterium]